MQPLLIFKLAVRNLIGAGLRTWLNVGALSFVFVTIIGTQGIYNGLNEQATHAMIAMELGGGQYWHRNLDPFDPLTFESARGEIPSALQPLIESGKAAPLLIVPGVIFPGGQMQTVQLKGLPVNQKILKLPMQSLANSDADFPVLIGSRMASATGLRQGDRIMVRWRDVHGTYDAREVFVQTVFKTSVGTVDEQQLWMPLKKLQQLTGLENKAGKIILAANIAPVDAGEEWIFHDLDYLLKDLREMVKTKSVSAMFMYILLLSLALLAIFDTQVLSIFKRRKEIGMLMALGMTRGQVIQLFTLEGAIHGMLAAGFGALYGIPLLGYLATHGWALPEYTRGYGMALGERLYPSYGPVLVAGTTVLVLAAVTIVSFLPARKIADMKPTETLRGKVQ